MIRSSATRAMIAASRTPFRSALATTGINCWMAPDDITPGQSYAVALSNAIKGSRALILVLSSHANESEHVPREVERVSISASPS